MPVSTSTTIALCAPTVDGHAGARAAWAGAANPRMSAVSEDGGAGAPHSVSRIR